MDYSSLPNQGQTGLEMGMGILLDNRQKSWEDNKVLIAKGYNMADYSNNLPNGPDTIYQIGSLTKAFTAAAILQLGESGKLSIDDPVVTYIKDYPNPKVTLYHLLTHTSGIPNYTNFPGFQNSINIKTSVDELIAKFKDKPA
ncbi:serine hydrolase domain-containing protein [Paenibacillus sp. PK3_47]|uniref:serine hydrolase domain-containing protein n=1 Tax=Paenibacillus sp. PK3_47 TaxID=2072642 RepID=UPI00201DCCC3|nr:serine hydrolase domain-containing protein [Paenibacillus sp. PK3_47]